MTAWIKIDGTTADSFALGFTGPQIKDDAGNLAVKTSDDNSHAGITAANVVVVNDATGFKVDLAASPSQVADYVFTLPPNVGVAGTFLQTAGNGEYFWEPAVQPGEFATDTIIAVAGQTGFTVSNSPMGDVSFSINGAVIAQAAATVAGTLVTYVPAQNFGYLIEANDEITISYIYGTTAAGDLNSLADVDVISPTNGSALIYNAATQKWVAGAGITDPAAITSGSSNVSIPSASGNVNVSVAGVANIATFTTAGGNITGNLDVTDTFTAVNANISGNVVAGNVTVPATGVVNTWDLNVANEAIVTGNLNVLGNLNTTDTNSFTVVGPIFEFGGLDPNNQPLSINDGMDRGMLLDYFTTSFQQAFFGWDNANGRFEAGAQVSNSNNVITVNTFANILAHTFIGNVEGGNISGNITGNMTGNMVNGTSNVVIGGPDGNITVAVNGVGDMLTVTDEGITTAGNLDVALHADIAGNLTVVGQTTLGNVGNVHITGGSNGQVLTTNGLGNLTWANLTTTEVVNGNSNVVIAPNGAITMSATGVANVVTVTSTAANIAGNLAVTGTTRLSVIGNVKINGGSNGQSIITDGTGNLSFATPNIPYIVAGNSNVTVAANGNVTTSVAGIANVMTVTATGANITGTANITGNLTAGNSSVAGTATTAALTVTGISQLGTVANVRILGGANGQVLTTNGTGNLVFAAPVVTDMVNGNSNVKVYANSNVSTSVAGIANVFTVTATGANVFGNIGVTSTATAANLTATDTVTTANLTATATANLGSVANVKITGGANGQTLVTDGLGNLVFATPGVSQLANGTSNVRVAANGNVTTSVNGAVNVLTVTASGANVTGTANITGNLIAANVSANNAFLTGSALIGANLTVSANGSVAGSLGVSQSLTVTANTTTANLVVNNNANVTGNLRVAADAYFSSVGNVIIPGGSADQLLKTDGNGNLSWTTVDTALVIQDQGVNVTTTANTINFVGSEVTTTAVGNVVTVNMTQGNISNINNGTSNVMIGLANGSVITSVNGVANVFTVTELGAEVRGTLSVTGITTLTTPANLKITGGSNGQVLTTDGTGNLSWANGSGGGSAITIEDEGNLVTNAASILNFTGAGVTTGILGNTVTINVPGAGSSQPTIEFVAPIDGPDQAFDDPAIFNLVSNTQSQVFVNGVLARVSDYTVAGTTLTFTRVLSTGDEITAAPVTVLTSVPQSAIASGSSGVVVSANANVGVSVAGVADVAVFSDTGATITGDLSVSGNAAITGAATSAELTVAGPVSFSDVANVSILGGSAGRVLSTDGTGNLSWVAQSGGGGATVVPVPTIEFVAVANGAGQVFTEANIANIASNTLCSTYVNGVLTTVADFTVSGEDLTLTRYINAGDVITVAAFGVTNIAVTGAGGSNTQLQFNNAGSLSGISSATYDGTKLTLGSNAQVKITGGTTGQALTTDGTGNLTWALPATAAGGIDTELQYNNGGVITGIPTATYDGGILYLGDVAEVSIAGGSEGQSLTTDGSGVLSWSPALIGSWTLDGPTIIGATTTAPTKGTLVNDFVRYRKIANREYQVQFMYNQSAAGTAGSGDYLFTLPAGLEFDLTAPGQVIVTVTTDALRTAAIPGAPAGMLLASAATGFPYAVTSVVVPYSATQFRVIAYSSLGGSTGSLTPMGSAAYKLSETQISMNLDFSFIATV